MSLKTATVSLLPDSGKSDGTSGTWVPFCNFATNEYKQNLRDFHIIESAELSISGENYKFREAGRNRHSDSKVTVSNMTTG